MKKFTEWLKLRESTSSNWQDFQVARGTIPQRYDVSNAGAGSPLSSISDVEGLQAALQKNADDVHAGKTTDRDHITNIKILHDRILDSHKVTVQDFDMFIKTILESITGDTHAGNSYDESHMVKEAWKEVFLGLDRDGFNDYTIGRIDDAMRFTDQLSRSDTRVANYFKQIVPLIRNVIKRVKETNLDYAKAATARRTDNRALAAWIRENPDNPNWAGWDEAPG